jgi:hypothetical protein
VAGEDYISRLNPDHIGRVAIVFQEILELRYGGVEAESLVYRHGHKVAGRIIRVG